MGRDISISISAKDNFTATITKMKTATAQFKAEGVELGEQLEALNKQKATLQVDATKAQAELKSARKGLDDTKESMDRLEQAQYNYNNIRQNLGLVTKQAKETEKAYISLTGAVEKANKQLSEDIKPAASGSGNTNGLVSRLSANFAWSEIANSELVAQLVDTAAMAGSQYIGSAFGAEAANSISSILSGGLSGATSGAAIGTMLGGPGVGTAVGAAIGGTVGAVTGGISAELDKQQSRDDYFKEYYQDFYTDLTSQYQTSLENGKTVAASREQTALAFSTLLGSSDKAAAWTDWMQEFAAVTPFAFEDLTSLSKTAFGYKFGTEETKGLMQAVGDAGSALGLSGEDLTNVTAYLGQMNMTDKVSLDYIKPLIERGIPAIDYIAQAMSEQSGKQWTTQDVYDAVSKGTLDGSDMVVEILARMEEDFAGSMDEQSQTYAGLTSTLEDTMTQLDAAMGQGYIEARKSSLQDQIDFYGGAAGEQMQQAYDLIGQWQASMENTRDQLKMDALSNVMNNNDDFQTAVASGTSEGAAEAGRMLAEALIQAQADYTQTDGYDLMMQTQEALIGDVRDGLSESNWQAGYELGLEFSKGIAAGMSSEEGQGYVGSAAAQLSAVAMQGANAPRNAANTAQAAAGRTGKSVLENPFAESDGTGHNHATGLEYVPYNGYPALLHEGERVMTASENRAYSSGNGTGSVVITGNNFTIRSDDDIERLGQEFYKQLLKAYQLRG